MVPRTLQIRNQRLQSSTLRARYRCHRVISIRNDPRQGDHMSKPLTLNPLSACPRTVPVHMPGVWATIGDAAWLDRLAAWAEALPSHRRLGSWTTCQLPSRPSGPVEHGVPRS
jgi:hypothetical protein